MGGSSFSEIPVSRHMFTNLHKCPPPGSVSAKLHFHFLTLMEYFVNNKQNLAETGHISVEAIEIHINILAEAELNQLNG